MSSGIKFDPINKSIVLLNRIADHALNLFSTDSNRPYKSLKPNTNKDSSRESLDELFSRDEPSKAPLWKKRINILANDKRYPASAIAESLAQIYTKGITPYELLDRVDETAAVEDPDLIDIELPFIADVDELEKLDSHATEFMESSQVFGDLLVLIDKAIELHKALENKVDEVYNGFDFELKKIFEHCHNFAQKLQEKLVTRLVNILIEFHQTSSETWTKAYQGLKDLLASALPRISKDEISNGKELFALIQKQLREKGIE